MQPIVVLNLDGRVLGVFDQLLQLIIQLLVLELVQHFAEARSIRVLHRDGDCVRQVEEDVSCFGFWMRSNNIQRLLPLRPIFDQYALHIFRQFLRLFNTLMAALHELLVNGFIVAPVLLQRPHDPRRRPCGHLIRQGVLPLTVNKLGFVLSVPADECARIAASNQDNLLERSVPIIPSEERLDVLE